MPTKHKDGHISVLLSYADDGFALNLPDIDVGVNFSGIDRKYKVVKSVIDKNNANAYTKFLELGAPQEASEEIQDVIRKAGELKFEEIGSVDKDNTTVTINMTNNSVILIELF